MYRCPNQKNRTHRDRRSAEFRLNAVISVDEESNFLRVEEHFFDVVVCGVCGEDAEEI